MKGGEGVARGQRACQKCDARARTRTRTCTRTRPRPRRKREREREGSRGSREQGRGQGKQGRGRRRQGGEGAEGGPLPGERLGATRTVPWQGGMGRGGIPHPPPSPDRHRCGRSSAGRRAAGRGGGRAGARPGCSRRRERRQRAGARSTGDCFCPLGRDGGGARRRGRDLERGAGHWDM